ncbi:DUF6682 family protein [Photobacterium damselae]|uniref:phage adaptor protein n=1 Tax=Photobacterium damselae TaxID=38293 RepID=UPI001F35E0CD|nr:DUF6682 family protein [Photobacterium damselae]UKA11712.1 hypothetical protein IHC91_18185 [Photobacterium damselae subsp. damselae]
MKVKILIDRVSRELVDPRNARWYRDELTQYLSEAIGVIAAKQPGLVAKTIDLSVTSSPINLPSDGYTLLAVHSINGIAAQYVFAEKLDQMYPSWQTDKGTPVCWTKREYDLKRFWIYPQPTESVVVSILYVPEIKILDEEFEVLLPNIYEGALVDFMMYRAYSRDGENVSEANKSQQHFQSFSLFLNDDQVLKSNREQRLNQSIFK